MRAKRRRLHAIIKLHHELDWSEIAREALRRRMHARRLISGLTKAKGLTVRQVLKLDRAVKDAFSKGRRLSDSEDERD